MSRPLGQILIELGILPDDALADVLARQGERLPVASLAYVLGYATERSLAEALAVVTRRPAIVLDECVIDVGLLAGVDPQMLLDLAMVPVCVEGGVLYVAAARPEEAEPHARAVFAGHQVSVCVALAVGVARAVRGCLAGFARGESRWIGAEAAADSPARHPRVALVERDDTTDDGALGQRAEQAVIEDVTKEIEVEELFPDQSTGGPLGDTFLTPRPSGSLGGDAVWPVTGVGSQPGRDTDPEVPVDDDIAELVVELEEGPTLVEGEVIRLLIVDDDFATRHLLVKEIEPRGYEVMTAVSGTDAVTTLRDYVPDVVISDILLPGVDGFRLCRAIKRTPRLAGVGVILMSAVIDSGRVTAEVLERYGADGYAAKPLDTGRLLRIVRELVGRRRVRTRGDGDPFAAAIARYQDGDVDGAIALLRDGVSFDPSATRTRFALANLLQRCQRIDEAIDEYESVVELEPRYFPALTRLAYLYYRKGHVVRAVETWRRALPHCADPSLRRNIELFVRKLAIDSLAGR